MASLASRVLVADDQQDVLEALKLLLKGEGFEVETAASPRAVLAAIEARDFDALLVDMNYTRDTTSGAEGLDLLSRIQGLESAPPVVVMTAWGSIDGAVEAMRRGARDYVRFLVIAAGSLTEIETQLFVSLRLGFITDPAAKSLLDHCAELGRMLSTLRRRVRASRAPRHAPSPRPQSPVPIPLATPPRDRCAWSPGRG